ncbi:predicted protein [Naegleria gruberi]|uniref:Predicted protein n=1 Tax=Naegleria gruberi TaxID=5762 RepID=D2V833_NAEGR|nr:uncharacterized protein NAEGRDRAFT_47424 [Naegleria gruberi]EFC46974.1 predicted protein [Naegleria gruberi]|eukprot:XP_002679718.1 predicted protein [Naegleria gruberi strain NEG-M]
MKRTLDENSDSETDGENNPRKKSSSCNTSSYLATDAKLCYPFGVFVSPTNEIYIADQYNHRVRKILESGRIVTIAGNGKGGFSGDDGLATNAQLNCPSSVFVSNKNEVFIADQYNHRIRKILESGRIVTIAGNGEEGFSGDNGPATSARLNCPMSIFVSNMNEVYFVDSNNNRVRKILENGIIVTIAGNEELGFSGDSILATNAKLNGPVSLHVSDKNEVYFAELKNNKIRKILRNGFLETVMGDGFSTTSVKVQSPTSVFVSPQNEIYFSDNTSNRIRKILENGNVVTVAGTGQQGFSGDGGPATRAQLACPTGLFVTLNNEIYFADSANNRIRKVLENGNIVTIAGNGKHGYSGDAPFDFSLHPHIGSTNLEKQETVLLQRDIYFPKIKLKKYNRDRLFGLDIYGFMPLLENFSPEFSKTVLRNEKLLCEMDSSQREIVQKLIDSMIYNDDKMNFNEEYTVNVLYILGFFKNAEFLDLKQDMVTKFINSLSLTSLSSVWEKVEELLKICENLGLSNFILEKLNKYCTEYTAVQLKSPEGSKILSNISIILRNSVRIFPLMAISEPSPIIIDEIVEKFQQGVNSLYNDKGTYDFRVKLSEDEFLYCHKTILSSSSSIFETFFQNQEIDNIKDGFMVPDPSENVDLVKIIIQACYRCGNIEFNSNQNMSLLSTAMKHEMKYLIDCWLKNFKISVDNYFEVVSVCKNYLHLPCCEEFYQLLLMFGSVYRAKLFTDCDRVALLPDQLLRALLVQISSDGFIFNR